MRGYDILLQNIRTLIVGGLAAISIVATAVPARAIDAASAAPYPAPSDPTPALSKPAQSAYKPYFAEFRARAAASYGHMYVLYGQVNGHNEIIKSDIVGLHPAGDGNDCDNCSLLSWMAGHLIFVPAETGASDGDLEEKYVTARYRVMMDAATYKKLVAYVTQIKSEKQLWHAALRSCVTFGNNVAETIGLKTPNSFGLEPKDYVEALRQLNGGKPQGPLRFATSSSSALPDAPKAGTATAAAPSKPKKQPVANSQAPTANATR